MPPAGTGTLAPDALLRSTTRCGSVASGSTCSATATRPQFQVTFPDGAVRDYAQPFVPAAGDPNFTSEGAVKVTDPPGVTGDDMRKHQLAIVGIFAPTAVDQRRDHVLGLPGAMKPGVAVDIYRGDLGMESGRAQSVFAIDQDQVDKGALVKQERVNLYSGQSVTLDDGTTDHLHRADRNGCRCRPPTTRRSAGRWCPRSCCWPG